MYTLFDAFPYRISDRFVLITLVVILTLFLFLFQVHPTMFDPDGFFHAKMAVLTSAQGYVTDFTWLPYTTLAEYWTDQHYVYHIFLVPFVTVFDPLWGVKIAGLMLGVLFGIIFFLVLKKLLGVSRPAFWWTLVLFSSAGFILRITQVKAQPFALILFFLILLALYRKQYFLFFLITFLYVNTHGSFILIPFVVGWQFLFDIFTSSDRLMLFKKATIFLTLSLFAIFLGLFTQPTFPENLTFYYHQIIEIAFLRTGDLVITGLEWSSLSFFGWIRLLGPLFIPIIIILFALFVLHFRVTRSAMFFVWLLFPFVLLTSRSVRHLDFFIPLLILSLAIFWHSVQPTMSILASRVKRFIISYPFATIIILIIPFVWGLTGLVRVYSYHSTGNSLFRSLPAASFINTHVSQKSVIANLRWDMFPEFFYYTDHQYITGLDPGFYYLADNETYAQYNYLRHDDVSILDFVEFMDRLSLVYLLTMVSVHDELHQVRLFNGDISFKTQYRDEIFRLLVISQ